MLFHARKARFRTISTSLWDYSPYILLHAQVPGVFEITIQMAAQVQGFIPYGEKSLENTHLVFSSVLEIMSPTLLHVLSEAKDHIFPSVPQNILS